MSIDFSKKEQREGYLQNKLDDLLDGINASYGQSLLDELMIRLEATVDDFNKEVDDLMENCFSRLNQVKLKKLLKKPPNLMTMKLPVKSKSLVSGKND